MRFVEALGSSTLVQHSRPLFLSSRSSTMAGTKTTTRAPTITHWQGKILPIGLPSAQVLQCSTPGSVSRWTGGGSRGRPPLFFQPVHCYFQRRNNEGGGEDGGEGGEEGEATSSWELTAPSFTFHRLPRTPAPTGSDGFGRVGGFWVSSCTTTWHNYIFDL